MANIIVAFSKAEDAKNIKSILVKNGFKVIAVCTSGAQALNYADEMGSGIVVCGGRFADMMYEELHECLPSDINMLLIASPELWSGKASGEIVCLGRPLKVIDLVNTLEMMTESLRRERRRRKLMPRNRDSQEQALIDQAKQLLMTRNHMTEDQAHRYVQRCSMDSGTNLVETAQMIISLNHV